MSGDWYAYVVLQHCWNITIWVRNKTFHWQIVLLIRPGKLIVEKRNF